MKNKVRRRAVIAELKKQPWLRSSDLAEKFQVSVRTIGRDLAALRRQGIPVDGRRGKGVQLREGFVLEAVSFTCEEAALMLVGGKLVGERLGQDLPLVVLGAEERLRSVGDDRLEKSITALEEKLKLTPGGVHEAERRKETLALLRHALMRQVTIVFTLDEEEYTFNLYGLTREGRQWYAVGYCHARDAVCSYLLDKMHQFTLLEETFTRPKSYEPDIVQHEEKDSQPFRVQFDAHSSYSILAATPSFVKTVQKKHDGIVVTVEGVPEKMRCSHGCWDGECTHKYSLLSR